jgi:hypothetical protein
MEPENDDLDSQEPTGDPLEPETPEGDPPADPDDLTPEPEVEPEPEPDKTPDPEPEPDPFAQEIDQLAGEFAKETEAYVPQSAPDDWTDEDYENATAAERKVHVDTLRAKDALQTQLDNTRNKYDGSGDQPSYAQAIKDSGLEERFAAEQQSGTGPLVTFLSKQPNPFEAIYKLGVSTLKKQGKLDAYKQTEAPKPENNGSSDMANANSADAVKSAAAAAEPRGKGLAGVRGTPTGETPKYTMESVAEIAKDPKAFDRLSADVKRKALEGTLPMANA